jgi:ribosomal protein L31E
MTPVNVRVDPDAAKFAWARGAAIYIWASDSGFLHVSVNAPRDLAGWESVLVDEIEVWIDPSLAGAVSWQIGLRRFPRRAFVASSNFTGTPVQDVWGSGLT